MATGAAEGERKVPRASPRLKIRLSPVGFWSYSRRDDELSRGRLSQLRSLLLAEIQTQYGRDGIQLFQDVSAIPHGADWERITTGAIDESTFFIPIVTPFYMQSRWCARETKMFEAREEAIFETHPDLSRDRRRVFPLLWIDVSDVEALDEEAAAALKVAQWCDFSHLRHRNLDHDEEVLAKVAAFAKSIVDVLQLKVEAPLSEEEKAQIAREAEEAGRRAEEERERREAEAREAEQQRALDAERRAAEEEERRAAEEEAQRRTAEEQERDKVARDEDAREREAERMQREEDREARRRALREARLALIVVTLRSRKLWLGLGGAVTLLLVTLSLMRPGDGPERRPVDAPDLSTPSPAPPANAPTAPAADTAPAPAIRWLLHRWCVGGNRANVQTIGGDRTRISIAFAGGTQFEAVRGIEEGVVTTEIARYRREGNALIIEEMGRQQRLERCE